MSPAIPLLLSTLALACLLPASASAAWFRREPPRPGKTTLGKPVVELPAQLIGNYLVITARWDRSLTCNFLIDTGASVTLVSPGFAQRQGNAPAPSSTTAAPSIAVKSADGEMTTLQSCTLRRLDLGEVRFENVPALVYDCSALSVHLGLRIDGILGFPLFRETLLTLDYLHQQVRLTRLQSTGSLLPGDTISFTNEHRTPFIPLRIGEHTFIALIDSGSDAAVSLNPLGLPVNFVRPPRPGALVATLTGDSTQMVARIQETLHLGETELVQPIVDVTDDFSSIGGGVLRHFCITFNQERNQVTFYRPRRESIGFPSRRTTGLSFTKAGAYWRVAAVLSDSPAHLAKIEVGDLVTRINQESVERWGPGRWDALLAQAPEIVFSFLVGRRETELPLKVMELVP